MRQVRANAVAGELSASLGSEDTTMESDGLADLPVVVASQEYERVALIEENADTGRIDQYEILYVVDHDEESTTAVVERGREGTDSQSWGLQSVWRHVDTVETKVLVKDLDDTIHYLTELQKATDYAPSLPPGLVGDLMNSNDLEDGRYGEGAVAYVAGDSPHDGGAVVKWDTTSSTAPTRFAGGFSFVKTNTMGYANDGTPEDEYDPHEQSYIAEHIRADNGEVLSSFKQARSARYNDPWQVRAVVSNDGKYLYTLSADLKTEEVLLTVTPTMTHVDLESGINSDLVVSEVVDPGGLTSSDFDDRIDDFQTTVWYNIESVGENDILIWRTVSRHDNDSFSAINIARLSPGEAFTDWNLFYDTNVLYDDSQASSSATRASQNQRYPFIHKNDFYLFDFHNRVVFKFDIESGEKQWDYGADFATLEGEPGPWHIWANDERLLLSSFGWPREHWVDHTSTSRVLQLDPDDASNHSDWHEESITIVGHDRLLAVAYNSGFLYVISEDTSEDDDQPTLRFTSLDYETLEVERSFDFTGPPDTPDRTEFRFADNMRYLYVSSDRSFSVVDLVEETESIIETDYDYAHDALNYIHDGHFYIGEIDFGSVVQRFTLYDHEDLPDGLKHSYQLLVGKEWYDLEPGVTFALDEPASKASLKALIEEDEEASLPDDAEGGIRYVVIDSRGDYVA